MMFGNVAQLRDTHHSRERQALKSRGIQLNGPRTPPPLTEPRFYPRIPAEYERITARLVAMNTNDDHLRVSHVGGLLDAQRPTAALATFEAIASRWRTGAMNTGIESERWRLTPTVQQTLDSSPFLGDSRQEPAMLHEQSLSELQHQDFETTNAACTELSSRQLDFMSARNGFTLSNRNVVTLDLTCFNQLYRIIKCDFESVN